MGIGAYRHRVTLAHPAVVTDPADWYCQVQSAASQVVDGQAAYFVRGRYHPGITLETQILFEGRTLQVQGVTDLDERHVELQLVCVEVVGRGTTPPPSVGAAPTITTPPQSTSVAPGQWTTLTVVATGTPPLAYQWTKDGVDVPGATSASFMTGPLTVAASYAVRVSNGYGTVTSAAATVAIGVAPTITTPPVGETVETGESVTLTVVAAGTPPLAYQWTVDSVAIPGATSASYVTGPLTTTASYAVTVANAFGTVTSPPVTVTVEAPASPLLTNLVSYWKLDEASGTRSDAHGTNHLTPTNAPVGAAGKLGTAVNLAASSVQYLSHASNSDLQLGDRDWTIQLWAYLNAAGNQTFLAKDGVSREYHLDVSTGQIRLYWVNVGVPIVSAPRHALAQWGLILVWYDATANTLNLQINNGSVVTVSDGGNPPPIGAAEFRIGHSEAGGIPFDGKIDEVAIWKRLLTPAERTALYNGGAGLAYPFA